MFRKFPFEQNTRLNFEINIDASYGHVAVDENH